MTLAKPCSTVAWRSSGPAKAVLTIELAGSYGPFRALKLCPACEDDLTTDFPPLPAPLPAVPLTPEAWLIQAARQQYDALGLIYGAIRQLALAQEDLRMATNDFQSQLDRNTAATAAASTAIQNEIQQLKTAIDALSTSQAPTQAQIDQLSAASQALEQATASLVADDDPNAPANP
jgi:hypothetical protein